MALENKLGITNSAELSREEERISKKKAVELFENGILDQLEAGKFSALKAIHTYLFDEIYDFAGKLRTVNIAKGNFRFAPLMYLETSLKNIERWYSMKEIMEYLGVSRDTVIDWIERRNMPAAKIGRLWKFKISEVDAWMKSGIAADK